MKVSFGGDTLRHYPAQWPGPNGGSIQFVAPWQPGVVIDRELITVRQNPSDHALASASSRRWTNSKGRLTREAVPLRSVQAAPWAAFSCLMKTPSWRGDTVFSGDEGVVPALRIAQGMAGQFCWAVAAMPALTTAQPRPWLTLLTRWNRSRSPTTRRLICWRAVARPR